MTELEARLSFWSTSSDPNVRDVNDQCAAVPIVLGVFLSGTESENSDILSEPRSHLDFTMVFLLTSGSSDRREEAVVRHMADDRTAAARPAPYSSLRVQLRVSLYVLVVRGRPVHAA